MNDQDTWDLFAGAALQGILASDLYLARRTGTCGGTDKKAVTWRPKATAPIERNGTG